MSQQPPPPPYGGPPPPGPFPGSTGRPVKARPKKRWWFLGGGLLALAALAFVVGLVVTITGATQTDAVVDATATTVDVEVEAGEQRMLFVPDSQVFLPCTLSDAEGRALVLNRPRSNVTVSADGETWNGVGTFTSPTSSVSVACDGPPGSLVRIGAPLDAGFVGGILFAVFAPLLLGTAGLAVLITTTVLWVTRKPDSAPPAPRR